jgi:hypothetical protein
VVALGHAGDRAGDPDAVGPHDDRDVSLPFSSRTLRSRASAYFLPSWKMWPISMPRAATQAFPLPARGADVADLDLGGLDGAVGAEVAPGDEPDDVLPGLLAPVTHAVPFGDPRVGEVTDAGRGSRRPERPGRCSPEPGRGAWRTRLVERQDDAGSTWAARRFSSTWRSPGTPMTSGSAGVPSGWASRTTTFLSVSAAVQGRRRFAGCASLRKSTRVSIVGVPGVSTTWADGIPVDVIDRLKASAPARPRRWRHTRSSRSARRCPRRSSAVARNSSLRAAHRPGHRLDDDVVEAEPVEDLDVGIAVGVVAGLPDRRRRRRRSRSPS